ncbi:MAG: hypothetical protein ACOX3C_04210 [Bacilli bacterium]|jgi:hypothetical protein
MKFKKLLLIPLAALLLNGCALGKKVDTQVAKARVAEAIKTQEEIETDTYSQNTEQDLVEKVTADREEGTITEKATIKGKTSVKAKGLRSEKPEFAVSVKGLLKVEENNKETMFGDITENIYYVDGWLYEDYDVTFREEGRTREENGKMKANIGKLDFINNHILDVLDNYVGGSATFDVVDFEEVKTLGEITDNITAREFGGVLTVTYKISKDDLVRYIASQLSGIDYGDLTSEEREAVDAMIDLVVAQIEKGYKVRKYEIVIEIAKEGYIQKIRVDQDVKQTVYDPKDTSDNPAVMLIAESKGFAELNIKINEKVTIKYPNFSDYTEIL